MEQILQFIGLSFDEFINLVIVAIAALVGLFLLRMMFKLTATLLRLGCAIIVIGLGLMFVLNVLN
ncbi:MAG: hypothetical protein KDE51_16260 [Anaerolineales bacterium]|nr:hypothetical protein [Anaerolineales bacterium]